jgi:hypothetical protein
MGDPEKEDIEASEAAAVNRWERPLAKLEAAMGALPRQSDAWIDFTAAFEAMLHLDLGGGEDDVGVPGDLWDYWMAVANGQSPDYDILGVREIDD